MIPLNASILKMFTPDKGNEVSMAYVALSFRNRKNKKK